MSTSYTHHECTYKNLGTNVFTCKRCSRLTRLAKRYEGRTREDLIEIILDLHEEISALSGIGSATGTDGHD